MKLLLATLLLASAPAMAQMGYSIKTSKETVEIHQADGIVVTLPRAKPAVESVDGEVVVSMVVKMTKKGEDGEFVLVLANMQKYCINGKGQVGVISPNGTLVALMPYDQENTVAKFVGNYLCKQAGINGRTM